MFESFFLIWQLLKLRFFLDKSCDFLLSFKSSNSPKIFSLFGPSWLIINFFLLLFIAGKNSPLEPFSIDRKNQILSPIQVQAKWFWKPDQVSCYLLVNLEHLKNAECLPFMWILNQVVLNSSRRLITKAMA